jgi:hypothetical protein
LIQLAVEMEDRFQLSLSSPDAARARTIREVVDLVLAARAQKEAAR